MRQIRGPDTTSNDVYMFRGDSEEAPETETTNGGGSGGGIGNGSGSGSDSDSGGSGNFGSEFGSGSGCDSGLQRSPPDPGQESSVHFESDWDRAATHGGGPGGAANCSLPGAMEVPTVGGHAQAFGQPTEAMNFDDESLFNNVGPDMVVTEAAAPLPVGMASQADASAVAVPQPGQQLVSTRVSLPRPGILASDAWRRMAQNALGIVNLLLAPEPRSMQAGLGMPPLQHGWVQPGQVAMR